MEIHEVEGLIPHVQMGGLTETGGQQNLLFLSCGESFHLFFKLHPFKPHFSQNPFEETLVQMVFFREMGQQPVQVGGVLGDVGDHQAGTGGDGAAVWDGLPQQDLEQAAFPTPVFPIQNHPFPGMEGKGDRAADIPSAILDFDLGKDRQRPVSPVGQGREFEGFQGFPVLQKAGFGLDCLLLPGFYGLGALHHLLGLVADVSAVHRPGAVFLLLDSVRPDGGLPGRLPQAGNVLLEPFLLGLLEGLLPVKVFQPGGEGPVLHGDVGAVEG